MGNGRGRRVDPQIRSICLSLIDESHKKGCRKAIACKDLDIGIKTYRRWQESVYDQRKGPKTVTQKKLTEEEKQEVIKISTSEKFRDLSPRQIVPSLADEGIYIASESTFYRILNAEKMLAHRGKSKSPKRRRPHPLMATGPNQIWSWDITYLKGPIRGSFFYLYFFMDIFSRKIVGFDVHNNESMDLSAQLMKNICQKEGISKNQLTLHSDNGGPMKGATMLATLQNLGVVPSFSRPRVSDDNPYSESLFKTLKYCPKYPSNGFNSIEEAKEWVELFVDWYNNIHRHSGIKFVTPAQKHDGVDIEILENRKNVYLKAKNQNPNRWSKEIRNWNPVRKVYLNHLQKEEEVAIKIAS